MSHRHALETRLLGAAIGGVVAIGAAGVNGVPLDGANWHILAIVASIGVLLGSAMGPRVARVIAAMFS